LIVVLQVVTVLAVSVIEKEVQHLDDGGCFDDPKFAKGCATKSKLCGDKSMGKVIQAQCKATCGLCKQTGENNENDKATKAKSETNVADVSKKEDAQAGSGSVITSDAQHKRAQQNAMNIVQGATKTIKEEVNGAVADIVNSVKNVIKQEKEKQQSSSLGIREAMMVLNKGKDGNQADSDKDNSDKADSKANSETTGASSTASEESSQADSEAESEADSMSSDLLPDTEADTEHEADSMSSTEDHGVDEAEHEEHDEDSDDSEAEP